ncbi:MAG: hypothetical protein CMJ31_00275 [Phycisphaerae bacterium]|nr:hypothetical protein [Phycisphaerae bacterium]
MLEVLADYQDYPNGGDGWLRIVTFDFEGAGGMGEVRFETYSPVLDEFQTETVQQVGPYASQFGIPIDFDERFMFAPPPEPPVPPRPIFSDLVIRQGLNGYTGTLDKEIRSSGGDENNGDATEISVDGDDGSPGAQPNDALIRFENIAGDAEGRIAAGTQIEQAFLQLGLVNPGSGFDLFELTTDWDESTTWTDFGGDGITAGVEAAAAPLYRVGADDGNENVPTGTLELDITALVQQWISEGPNFGVGLAALPNGSNGIDFTTSESANPPALVVRSLLPGIVQLNVNDDIVDTQLREADPDADESDATEFSVDASDGGGVNHTLIRFDNLFGDNPDQIALTADIARAFLTVTANNPGDGASLHRLLLDWNDTDTWNGAFGGDGIQADGIEAEIAPDVTVGGSTGSVEIDVTASLLAWQDGAPNHGWVLLPLGSDGWDFASSEAAESARPRLTVYIDTTPSCPDCSGVDYAAPLGVLDIADVVGFLQRFGSLDVCADLAAPIDSFDISDVVAFLQAFGAGCP